MEFKALGGLGKVAGIGGIALGILLLLLKDMLASSVLANLPPESAAHLLLIIVVGLFLIGGLGILAWVLANRAPTVPKVHAEGGSVALGDHAEGNQINVNNSGSSTKRNAGR